MKIEPLIYKSGSRIGSNIKDLFSKMNEIIDAVNALMPTESPKPDWVKEEIKEMMRPSDDLLRLAFETGIREGQKMTSPYTGHGKQFFEWLKTLPPDTLKEDRELVKVMVLNDGGSFVKRYSENVVVALKRLCGMEVGNGL